MFNNSGINPLDNAGLDILDILTVWGLKAQFENMARDAEETEYIHKVIHAISDEIAKLHEENDKILAELAEIKGKIEKGGG